jgi:hypothetical protein
MATMSRNHSVKQTLDEVRNFLDTSMKWIAGYHSMEGHNFPTSNIIRDNRKLGRNGQVLYFNPDT